MIAFSFQIDPHLVLGVPPGATLQEIRDAYRQQAKKYHPDAGGADWTFRVLVEAYEVLSTARIEQASKNESRAHGSTAPTARPEDAAGMPPEPNGTADPTRVVGVERLAVRFEAEPLWLVAESEREEHALSCSLNFKWPDPSAAVDLNTSESERILGRLAEVFEAMCLKTQVITSRIRVNDDSFSGWLSYPSLDRAAAAFRLLHGMLKAQGFEVKQWSRDLVIPRTWR